MRKFFKYLPYYLVVFFFCSAGADVFKMPELFLCCHVSHLFLYSFRPMASFT